MPYMNKKENQKKNNWERKLSKKKLPIDNLIKQTLIESLHYAIHWGTLINKV